MDLELTTNTGGGNANDCIIRTAELWDRKCLDNHVKGLAFEFHGFHRFMMIIMIMMAGVRVLHRERELLDLRDWCKTNLK